MGRHSTRYPAEVRERAVRLVLDHQGEHASQWEAVGSVAANIGCTAETLRRWVRQAERDSGLRPGASTDKRERIRALERENRELRQANEILRQASAYFAQAELDRRFKPSSPSSMITGRPAGSSRSAGCCRSPRRPIASMSPGGAIRPGAHGGRTRRAKRDAALKVEVRWVFEENFRVYGLRKLRRQVKREGFDVARCTVARLMREMGLEGAIRGKPVKTTRSDKAAPCPLDKVNRQFQAPAPNRLWVSDFTYVTSWAGFVYVAFVIDAYARRIPRARLRRPEDRLWLAGEPDGACRLRA